MASKHKTLLSRVLTICDDQHIRSAMKVEVIKDLVRRYLDPDYAAHEDMIEQAMGEDDYWQRLQDQANEVFEEEAQSLVYGECPWADTEDDDE